MKMAMRDKGERETDAGDIEPVSGQTTLEDEKNLSRHATKDSSPPIEEQWRTSVAVDDAGEAGRKQDKNSEQGGD
jgi:hypothetical protein